MMKIQAQIIGSLIRKAAVEVSLHPARIQGSEAKGAVCGEHRNESTPWRKRPRSGFGAWCVLLPPRVAQHYAEQPTSPTRDHVKCGDDCPETRGLKCPHKFVTTKRKRKCESATRKTLNMAVGALLLRGRLGPFVRRVSVCCPIMVSSLLALLSLLVTHALYSRVELPPCQVPQTGPRYLGDLKAAVCNELYILCCDRVRGVMRVRAFLLASCENVLNLSCE